MCRPRPPLIPEQLPKRRQLVLVLRVIALSAAHALAALASASAPTLAFALSKIAAGNRRAIGLRMLEIGKEAAHAQRVATRRART